MESPLKKLIMETPGLTQQVIADRLGLSLSWVNQVLNGRKMTTWRMAKAIEEHFGIAASETMDAHYTLAKATGAIRARRWKVDRDEDTRTRSGHEACGVGAGRG